MGQASDTTITNCYNAGIVEGTGMYVGGVVGYTSDTTITNCYNTGSVSGRNYAGGVVGMDKISSTITNCYNTGSVEGTGSSVGGVIGRTRDEMITNTYYGGDCEVSVGGIDGADVDGQAEYLADLEALAKNEEWYLDSSNWDSSYLWNFETVWAFVSGAPNYVVNNGYPVLQSFGIEIPEHEIIYWTDEVAQEALGVDFDNYSLTQDTSASTTTYLIQSETDLAFLSWTIYNNKAYNNHKSSSYFYSGISFKQTKNLDLSDYYWQPIGISYTRDGNGTSVFRYFSGNYDGDGHTVSSVFTPEGEGNNYYYQGLFGDVRSQNVTNMSTIQNIGVIDSFIQGSRGVGGVVGNAQSATITNCYNTGSFSGSYVGGVVGQASSAIITNCYNTGSFSVGGSVGGVVGDTSDSTITNCYNTGTVDGKNYVGGVVGHTPDLITITNCYNTGTVDGWNYVGGVVGQASSATITNCYNTGTVDGRNYIGGVAGRTSSATITNTYYGGDCEAIGGIKGADVDGQAEYLDNLEVLAKNEEWYLDSSNWNSSYPWDFETVWSLQVEGVPNYVEAPNNGYPYLQSFGIPEHEIIYWTDEVVQEALGVDFDNYSLAEDTSASATTYLIQSETDLAYLSWTIYNDNPFGGSSNKVLSDGAYYFYSDITFKQTQNLDLSDYYWQPIGIAYTREGDSVFRAFSGNYDGAGHTVSSVFTPEGEGNGYSYQGLFGAVVGRDSTQLATLQNIGVINPYIYGYQYVGGVASVVQNSIVSNCYNDNGRVISTCLQGGVGNDAIGGVVGNAYFSSTIINCYNTSSVSGRTGVSGVVAVANSATTITNCYNTGAISGEDKVGGVVGYAQSRSTITNCYNNGTVSGTHGVGGIVGLIYRGTIQNCLNFGNVSGNSNVGGIVGVLEASTIENCGVEGAMISGSSNVGIFVGSITNSSTAIQNCYAIVSEALSPYGTNSGTFTNCLWIAGGVKYYLGTDFSGFAWFNTDSCPIPKGLSWMGQFWTEDIKSQITSSSDWTEWVA